MNAEKRAERIKELQSKLARLEAKQQKLLSAEGLIRGELQRLYNEQSEAQRYAFK